MSIYRQNNKEILNLLEKLENKLNKHQPYNPLGDTNNNYNGNQPLFSTQTNMNINTNNYSGYSLNNQNNIDKISPSMEFNIRNLIRDEFTSLILPYQQELHNGLNIIDSKIDKNSNEIKDLKLKNINNIQNLISTGEAGFNFNPPNPLDNNQFVLRVEYDNKIKELEFQISAINTYSQTLKEAFDNNLKGGNSYLGRDDFGQKIKEIQNRFDSIFGDINQFKNNISNINQSLGEIKLNSNRNKNDLLNEIQNIKSDFSQKILSMNNNLSDVNRNNQGPTNNTDVNGKIQKVNLELNNLKNEFNVLTDQLDMNFMSSLKTIVNQHITFAEFNVVKKKISDFEENINNIINKNKTYDMNINNIQNNINNLENKINNINKNNKSSEIIELNDINSNDKKNINLDEGKINLLNELQKVNINKLQKFDFDVVNDIKNEINVIKNKNENDENLVILKTKINELDTQLEQLKEKMDFNKIISDLESNINSINNRLTKLEKANIANIKGSKLVVTQINDEDDNEKENVMKNNNILNNNNVRPKIIKEDVQLDNLLLYQNNDEIKDNNIKNKNKTKDKEDKEINFALDEDEIEENEEDNIKKGGQILSLGEDKKETDDKNIKKSTNNNIENNIEEKKTENNNKENNNSNKNRLNSDEFDGLDDLLIDD